MSRPAIFNRQLSSSLQVPSRLDLDLSETEIRGVIQENNDDLSTVVEKCNAKGFVKPLLSMDTNRPAISMPAMFRGGVHQSELFLHSPYSFHSHNRGKLHCEIAAATQTAPHFQCSTKRRRVIENEKDDQQQQSGRGGITESSSWVRENHILSERLRRSEMNILFARMHSLLPNPTGKNDKGSIVSETINYIQSLQKKLAKKQPSTLQVTTDGRSSVPEACQCPSFNCDKSDATLTLNYNQKDVFITLKCEKKPTLLPSIILVLESQNMEVVNAFVSITDTAVFHCLHVEASEILNPRERETLHGSLNKLLNSNSDP